MEVIRMCIAIMMATLMLSLFIVCDAPQIWYGYCTEAWVLITNGVADILGDIRGIITQGAAPHTTYLLSTSRGGGGGGGGRLL